MLHFCLFRNCHDRYSPLQYGLQLAETEHYTFGANAAFLLLLLVHVLPFTMLPGSMLAFFLSVHVRTATARCRAFSTVRGDTTLYSF